MNRDAFALRARPFVLQIPTRAVETLWDEVTHEFVARCVGLETRHLSRRASRPTELRIELKNVKHHAECLRGQVST